MTEQYAKRKINIRILANKGTNEEKEIWLEGLRCSARFSIRSLEVQGQMDLSIWGMTLDQMDSLTTFGPIMQERRFNEITVSAGEENGKMALVYIGTIMQAYADFNQAPNVVFRISSKSGAADQVRVVDGRAHSGGVDAAVILADLAKEMGKSFENHGVSRILRDRTFTGTALTQVREIVAAAQINVNIDRDKMVIWPKDVSYGDIIEVSTKTGLVGYPAFAGYGVTLTTLFNPEMGCGRQVRVDSSMKVANGIWNIYAVNHALESEIPGGAWFTQVQTYGRGLNL